MAFLKAATETDDPAGVFRHSAVMSNMPRPEPGEIYEHYKKKNYRVFATGLDASRQEVIVIYQALYPTDYDYFSRPLKEWNDQVTSLEWNWLSPTLSQVKRLIASIQITMLP